MRSTNDVRKSQFPATQILAERAPRKGQIEWGRGTKLTGRANPTLWILEYSEEKIPEAPTQLKARTKKHS
jgi:hypothetical protein